jgi:hypothetical protein
MEHIYIASMMLCTAPRIVAGRLILSGCDSVWEPTQFVPQNIKNQFTDDLGNEEFEYGGFLFPRAAHSMEQIAEHGLFACFRGIEREYLEAINCPLAVRRDVFEIGLHHMGWDIANGNGWLSAACAGVVPLNPFDGLANSEDVRQINRYGLFENYEDCVRYCRRGCP